MKFRLVKLINSLTKNGCCFSNMFSSFHICNNNKTKTATTKKLSMTQNIKLFYYTMLFNEENDSLMTIETMLQPFMGTMNNLVRYFGKIFVLFVWVLSLNMLNLFFLVILPQIYRDENFFIFLLNLILGTWMAVNTFFHYIMGWLTNPGEPLNV